VLGAASQRTCTPYRVVTGLLRDNERENTVDDAFTDRVGYDVTTIACTVTVIRPRAGDVATKRLNYRVQSETGSPRRRGARVVLSVLCATRVSPYIFTTRTIQCDVYTTSMQRLNAKLRSTMMMTCALKLGEN